MGFGEFWLQSKNGKKIDLNFHGKLNKSDFAGNERLLSIFNFFDKDGNGIIESDGVNGNEIANLFAYIKKTAELRKGGNDSQIDAQEAYSLTQNIDELKQVSSNDVFEFLALLEDKKKVVIKSDTYTYPDGTQYSVNHYSDGGEETVIYDKDGNVRMKTTEHPLSVDYTNAKVYTDENGNTVYDKRDENGRGMYLTIVPDSNYVAVKDAAQQYIQGKYGVTPKQAVFQDGYLIFLDDNAKPIAHIRYEISPAIKQELRTFVAENLNNLDYLSEILKDVGWIDRIGISLQDIRFNFVDGLQFNGQEILKQYLLEAIEDAKNGKYLKTMAMGEEGGFGVQHFDSRYAEMSGNDYLDFMHAERLRMTSMKYNEVKNLYQRLEILKKGLDEVRRLYKNAQTAKSGIPGSEKLNKNYDGKLVEVLKCFFYDNEEMTRAFIASVSHDIGSKDDLEENLPEILTRIENSMQQSLEQVLGGETFEQLEARYQREYKAVYGKEDVIPKIEEMVMDGKEIGSFVQMGMMTAATIIIGAFTGGTGSVALDAFIGYLETVGTDYALSLSNALTSRQGLTRESHQAILERTAGTAEFVGFGMVIANPLARTAGKFVSKVFSPSTSKLVGGAFTKGAVKGAVTKTTGSVVKTTLSGEQMLQFMMVKSSEFFTEVGAFTGFELATSDEEFIKAFGGQTSMLGKLKVMNSAIQVLLGSFVKNRAIAKNSKHAVKQYNQMLQDVGLKDAKISEHKSPSGTKYTLEMEGKSYTFNTIEELSNNLTIMMAVSYASSKEVSAEVQSKTTEELKAEYKRLMENTDVKQEDAELIIDIFNELTKRGEIDENGNIVVETGDITIPEEKPVSETSEVVEQGVKTPQEIDSRSSVMQDIESYIEGYRLYGEDYIPEGLNENSVFMEFFKYKQEICTARPEEIRGNIKIKARPAKDKIFDRTKGESPESCLQMMSELRDFILTKSQLATKEDYYQIIEEMAKQMPDFVRANYPDIRPEIAENADKIFKWASYCVGQASGERRADGSYEIKTNQFFDSERQQQAIREYTEFLENITGKKVLVGGTEVFGSFADMIGIFNNPEIYSEVDYIILGHGTGNSKITDTSSPDTWKFKYNGKSVWEYMEENVPEGKKALVLVCEHDGLSLAERKQQPDMVDNNGVHLRAIGVPSAGSPDMPLKICTSGIRHITGQVAASYRKGVAPFIRGQVIYDHRTVMYDLDFNKYKVKVEDSETQETIDSHVEPKPSQSGFVPKKNAPFEERKANLLEFIENNSELKEIMNKADIREIDIGEDNIELYEQILSDTRLYKAKGIFSITIWSNKEASEARVKVLEQIMQNDRIANNPEILDNLNNLLYRQGYLSAENEFADRAAKLIQMAEYNPEMLTVDRSFYELEKLYEFSQEYPEYSQTFLNILKSNWNIKVQADLDGKYSTNLHIVANYLKENPSLQAEITAFLSIQRFANENTQDPIFDLKKYIDILNSSNKQAAIELAKNPKLNAIDIKYLVDNYQSQIADVIELSKLGYTKDAIIKNLELFEKNPETRVTMFSVPKYQLIDETPETTSAEVKAARRNTYDLINRVAPDELNSLRNTLGDKYFENVKWEEIFPSLPDAETVKRTITQINENSKFFARTTVNENRYGKNLQWAYNMGIISDRASDLIRSGASFEEVMASISEDYHSYDVASAKDSEAASKSGRLHSGVLREDGYANTPFSKEDKLYEEYYARLCSVDCYNEKCPRKGKFNDNITLTQIYGEIMHHPFAESAEAAMKYVSNTYNEKLSPLIEKVKRGETLTKQEIQSVHETIAESYFLLANTMPYERGTNGICDIFMRSAYKALGINMPALKHGVSLDLESFCMNVDEYKSKWKTFFEADNSGIFATNIRQRLGEKLYNIYHAVENRIEKLTNYIEYGKIKNYISTTFADFADVIEDLVTKLNRKVKDLFVKEKPSLANIDEAQMPIINEILSFKSESKKLIDCVYIDIFQEITPEKLDIMHGLIELSKTCDNEILKNINNIRYIADDIAEFADIETIKKIFSQKDSNGNYVINLNTYDRFASEKFASLIMGDKVQPVSEDLRRIAEIGPTRDAGTRPELDKYVIRSGERTDNHMKYQQQNPDLFYSEAKFDDDSWAYYEYGSQEKCAWKMHLYSANEIDWQTMSEVVIPYLRDHGINFKTLSCACSPEEQAASVPEQAGKCFTIFPRNNEEMAQIARDLDYIIKRNNLQTTNSHIEGDRNLGDSGRIFYRYEYKSGKYKDEILDTSKEADAEKYNNEYYERNRGKDKYLADDMTIEDDIWYNFNPSEQTSKPDITKRVTSEEATSINQKIDVYLQDLKENSARTEEEVAGFKYFMEKYPDKADVIAMLAKSNYNIKVGTDIDGNIASHFDSIMLYINRFPQYEKEIIDYMSVQRRAFNDTSDPTKDLNSYIKMLQANPDKKELIAELTKNHNLKAGCVNLLITHDPSQYDDLIAISKRNYTENGINNLLRIIKKYPNLRPVLTKEVPQYYLIDSNPSETPVDIIRKRVRLEEQLTRTFQAEMAELKQTLGDFYYKVRWEDIIPDEASKDEIKLILDDINSASKFFARTQVNEKKHGKNIKWAMEMDRIAQITIEQMRDGKDFDAVIDQVAYQYHSYDESVTMDSNTDVSDRRKYSGQYRGYEYQREGAEFGALTPYDDVDCYNEYYERFKAISGQRRTYNNGEIQLTEIGVKDDYGDCMLHPRNDNVEPAMEYIRKNYQHNIKPYIEKVKNGGTLTEQEINEIHRMIASDYFLMANVMPWGRGSNGICDIYMRSLYRALGIEMPAIKQGVSLDLEAFCQDSEEYVANWLSFFEKRIDIE